MLSHGKLDLSYCFGGAKNCVDLLHISVVEIAEEIICHEFWRNMFVYSQTHLLMQAIASANKQLLSVVMQDNELTSSWSNHFRMLVASRKDDY